MAQVLWNLGTYVTDEIGRSEEHQAPTSFSPTLDLPNMEMPPPEYTEQPEPHIKVNNPLEQIDHTKETGEQSLAYQGGEDLGIPHKQ
jgi:hypothetical protein